MSSDLYAQELCLVFTILLTVNMLGWGELGVKAKEPQGLSRAKNLALVYLSLPGMQKSDTTESREIVEAH